jgi:hypothetical protein
MRSIYRVELIIEDRRIMTDSRRMLDEALQFTVSCRVALIISY